MSYGTYIVSPSKYETYTCTVCNSECEVIRNRGGNQFFPKHDYFYCPNNNKLWHNDAAKLKEFMDLYPSKGLLKIVQKDFDEIIFKYL